MTHIRIYNISKNFVPMMLLTRRVKINSVSREIFLINILMILVKRLKSRIFNHKIPGYEILMLILKIFGVRY